MISKDDLISHQHPLQLGIRLFDLIIFAAEEGPDVVETAWACCTNILVLIRRIHGGHGAGKKGSNTPPSATFQLLQIVYNILSLVDLTKRAVQ